ncbi:ribonuclease HII [Alphaproteobacteria bacterium]|nr:ribonuclease HII [Alphaproteobacteria bacterium]
MADFTLEKENYHKNNYMIGVDEVGRGSWAGPIVATACWLDYKKHKFLSENINDSKKINSINRKKIILSLNDSIKFSSSVSTAKEIDYYGLTLANFMSMKRALWCLCESVNKELKVNYLNIKIYIDGKQTPNFSNVDVANQNLKKINLRLHSTTSLVKGDNKSKTIALASIIAKETRDSIMKNYSISYPNYKFDNHFGYGTKKHIEAIKKFGISPIHRKSFKPISPYIVN